jgi:cyclopropane-fatty-acyl-phospholipid synthase
MAILSPLLEPATTIWNSVSCQAWDSLVAMCRDGTLSQLQGIQIGKLVVYQASAGKGSTVFGTEREGHPVAVLNVHDDKFWVRLALFADMVRLSNSPATVCGVMLAYVCAEANRLQRASQKAIC